MAQIDAAVGSVQERYSNMPHAQLWAQDMIDGEVFIGDVDVCNLRFNNLDRVRDFKRLTRRDWESNRPSADGKDSLTGCNWDRPSVLVIPAGAVCMIC
jgi:hypothetical protein